MFLSYSSVSLWTRELLGYSVNCHPIHSVRLMIVTAYLEVLVAPGVSSGAPLSWGQAPLLQFCYLPGPALGQSPTHAPWFLVVDSAVSWDLGCQGGLLPGPLSG